MPSTPSRKARARLAAAAQQPVHDAARLEALFASIGEGVIATDDKGIVTRVNAVALQILGYRSQEVIGQRFPDTIIALHDNGTRLDIYDRPITKAFMTGKTIQERTSYLRADGNVVPVSLTVSPIILKDKPIGAIEVFRDLTGEIENEKMKSDFISIASHQLRTPLSAINMYTRMLQDGLAGDLSEQQLAFTKIVLTSVERMNELIDTLLNITRIEAGSITIKPRPLQINDLLQEISLEFMPAAESKDITLVTDIPRRMPDVITDSLLIKEVCANLISNAIKYTPEGGTVTVELQNNRKDIVCSVRDTGYGIPAEAQKRIFTKFFRAGNITSRDVSGTGLGLYLTKSLMEALGGELWFTSKENAGSTFCFCLPKCNQSAPKATTD